MNDVYFQLTDKGLRLAEANIQAEFYHQARLIGLNCVLELSTPVGRLDIAVLDAECGQIMAIIECKNCRPFDRKGSQFRKYSRIGVRIFELFLMGDCAKVAWEVDALLRGGMLKGVSFAEVYAMERHRRRTKIQRLAAEWDEDLIIRD